MLARNSFEAVVDGRIAGFSDVANDGFIDMLFVAPQYQRRGIATILLRECEARARRAGTPVLWANVSVTARPLFERLGFRVDRAQHPSRGGVTLTNYRMSKALD